MTMAIYKLDNSEENDFINYIAVEEMPEFLQEVGLALSKPTLIRQQLFGVVMRTLPETELFEDGKDTRKRFYHPFSVFETIAASKLFSGDYWTEKVHAARLVQLDVFIGRLGYYAKNYRRLNSEFNINRIRDKEGEKYPVTFPLYINEVFHNLLQESEGFTIQLELDKKSKAKTEIIKRKSNAKIVNGPERRGSDLILNNNEMGMTEDNIENLYTNFAKTACCRIFSAPEAQCYMQYQTLMYTRTMEAVITNYKGRLLDYLKNK